ncbi:MULTISPECIES: phosphodiesterase [unclassified Paraburkholderia]|uniref:phosphodiesterase n=1 Tax=unclassified Paraburkholderia TaxID=2615204 RepID=UPI002AB29959|nr:MULTISPECIES: phosphodiesterase [unclassified Paraburkholderia]
MIVIAQVSDIHVRPRGRLYQDCVDSNAMFAEAVETLNRLNPAPQLVLITGDLTDEGVPEEYAMLRELLVPLKQLYAVMPGNHDDRAHLRSAFGDQPWPSREGELNFGTDVDQVRVLALNTTVSGLHHGELSEATLLWLERELVACTGRPAVIAMHHPPFTTGIPYLNLYGLRPPEALGVLPAKHAHAGRIIAGHVHRSMHTRFGAVPIVTCPRTTTQIALRLHGGVEAASLLEPPAFMLHHWSDAWDSAVSHLCYIGQFEGPLPFA